MTIRVTAGLVVLVGGLTACANEVISANTGGSGPGSTATTSGGGAAGGGGTTSSSSSTTSSSSSTTSSSSGTSSTSSSGGACTAPCCLGASCKAVDKECVGLVDNAGLTKFGLRMSELDVTKPAALKTGLVAGIIGGAVAPSNASCNLNGSATLNWLLQFDTAAGTLKTGGAKPVPDAQAGYAFIDETVQGKPVHPVTFAGVTPDANGNFSVAQGNNLFVPVYLDAAAMSMILLPIKDARFTMGALSASHDCIGHYNGEGLDPLDTCLPDATHHSFVTGAQLAGMITLEDADSVVISPLAQSLCVLLSQDTTKYGFKDTDGITKCKRTNGVIDYQGDTCSMAGGTCKDTVSLSASFAASSVQINN